MKKKWMVTLLALVLVLQTVLMAGCGSSKVQSPDSLVIQYDGEACDMVEVLYGTEESVELTAVLSPSDFSGEVTWTSDDAGVAKVGSSDGSTCTLTILKVGTAKITASCGETTASVKVKVGKNQENLAARDIAYSIHGEDYSVERINIAYVECYNEFVSEYGSYASYYGLDTSEGLEGLAEESCDYSDDGTWRGYFLEEAVQYLIQYQALCDYAAENDITLDEEEQQEIEDQISNVEQAAAENGFSNTDAYVESIYGDNATLEVYRDYLETSTLAIKVYNEYCDNLTYSDQEIADHYEEMGYSDTDNDYPMTSMRHILIMAEADADGNYTDEAIQAAHDKAEEIYEEWKSGAADEESFAALAEEYSDDTGSNTKGGLYEDIYKDQMVDVVNDFLFAEGRQYGDTQVVDYSGSYTGTHILFFCGEGEVYSTYLSVKDLRSDAGNDWLSQLTADYTAEAGAAVSEIGQF